MEKIEIHTREDVAVLVNTFYKAVRKDAFLGPFFTAMITNWETHLAHLTDFWCGQLFLDAGYEGNPMEKHRNVDKFFHHNMNEKHFEAWLHMWIATLDNYFMGENAQILKNKAMKMASAIHMDMHIHRNKNSEDNA